MKLLKYKKLIFIILIFGQNLFAGVAGYNFTTSVKNYNSITGQSNVVLNPGDDNVLSGEIQIGFNFVYDGVSYNKLKISSNGFITLNVNQVSSIPENSLSSNVLIIAPLWDDLSIGEKGLVHYQLIGNSPNRMLKIEFKDMKWSYSSSVSNANFQVLLYETSNKIEFIYGTIFSPVNASASIGISDFLANSSIANLNNNHFISITPGNPPSSSSVNENKNVNTVIPLGTCYTFTPPSPIIADTLYIGETGNYTTLQEAFDALRDNGIGKTITLKIISEYIAETNPNGIRIDHIPGTASNKRVYLKIQNNVNKTITINNATNVDYTIRLRGVQYLTIDGAGGSLTIVNSGVNPSSAIKIMDGTKNCVIKNLTLKAEGSNSAISNGVVLFSTANTNNNINLTNDNNLIENCLITQNVNRCANGILFYGGATPPYGTGNRIINSSITNWGIGSSVEQAGIYLRRGYINTELSGNEIYMSSRVPSYPTQANNLSGISAGDTSINVIINGNKIYRILPNLSTSNPSVRGIRFTAIASSQTSIVVNNFIALATDSNIVNGTGVIRGISDESVGSIKYYFNSIRIGGIQSSGSGSTACFIRTSTATNTLRNNIFFNERTNGGSSTGKHYAIYRSSASGFFSSDYNDLFVSGNGGVIGFFSVDRIFLSNWQTATGQDLNSLSVNPMFVSSTNLHLQPNSYLESMGTAITDMENDIDGDNRHTSWPDIGADEFDGYQPDPFTLISPENNSINQQISVILRWTKSIKARKYDLYFDTILPPAVLISQQDYSDTMFRIENLKKNTTYYWNVIASNVSGETNPSVYPFSFTTGDVPERPFNLSIDNVTENLIAISWSDTSTNIIGFRVYRSTNSTGPFTKIGNDLNPEIKNYIDTNLNPNSSYYYRVVSFNELGESNYIDCDTTTLAQRPNIPQIENVGYTWLTIIIDSSRNSVNTMFAIYEENTNKYVQANGWLAESVYWQTYTNWGRDKGITVRGLARSSNYSFKVKAKNNDNIETSFSNSNSAVTLTPITTFPYFNNFEGATNENWRTEANPIPGLPNPANDWVRGTFTKLSGPYSPTKAWVTKLSGLYSSNHNASLISPQFDFSGMTKSPTLSFFHNFLIETYFDAGVVEYTTDEGLTWLRLGRYNDPDGTNWYNNDSTGFGSPVEKPNWSGSSSGWKNARLKLTNLTGVPSVQFRFRFGSDIIGTQDGWAIDNFTIIPPPSKDIQVVQVNVSQPRAVNYPIIVSAKIRSLGTEANPEQVSLTYKVSTAPINQSDGVNQIFYPVWSGDSAIVTFTQTLIRTSTGTVKLYVRSFYSGDEVPSNDTSFTTFTVNPQGVYFTQGFESTVFPPTGWSVLDANNDGFSWKRSTVAPYRGVAHAAYSYNTQNINIGADDWLFTSPLEFDSSRAYNLKLYYRAKSSAYPERMRISICTAPDPSSQIEQLVELDNITTTTYQMLSRSFGVSNNGLYYIGFQCYSAPYMWDLYIDSIQLEIADYLDLALTSLKQSSGFPVQSSNKLEVFETQSNSTDVLTQHIDFIDIPVEKLPIVKASNVNNSKILNEKYFEDKFFKVLPSSVSLKAFVSNVGTKDVYSYNLNWRVNNILQPQYSGGYLKRFTGVDSVTLNYSPDARGTFISSAWIQHPQDTIRNNDSASTRLKIYPFNSQNILYDYANDAPQSMIGLNRNGKNLTAAVRFTTNQYIKLGNVDVFYTNKNNIPGDTYQSVDSIIVQVWAKGSSDSAPGALLYQKKFAGQNYITSNVSGESFSLPLGDDAPLFEQGTDYWISVQFDSLIRYPIGADHKSTGRSYFSIDNGASWSPLLIDVGGNLTESCWWLRSIVIPIGTITGTVYCDSNGNGIRDFNEKGIPNIKVYLSGDKIDSTLTDSLGKYYFINLEAGVYNVSQKLAANWIQTTSPVFHTITINSSNSYTGKDFGNFQLGNVSGRVIYDDDGDGIVGPLDNGIEGWKVYLYKDELIVDSTLSNDLGFYGFSNLKAGSYYILQNNNPGFIQTYPFGQTGHSVLIISGSSINNLNFGNYYTTGISGVVFHDFNADGKRDFTEPGLENWYVFLTKNNDVIDSKNTDFKGGYIFADLLPDTYKVSFEIQDNWLQSVPTDSGFYTLTLESYSVSNNTNFGVYKTGSISGIVYNDINGNKIKDEGEDILPEQKIYLYGLRIDSTITNESGYFSFTNLIPGSYNVSLNLMPNWIQSFPDSNANHHITLKSDENISNVSFGTYKLSKISGFSYNDINGNGFKDDEDSSLTGWLIHLYKDGVQIDSIYTSNEGYYKFENLKIGNYIVLEQLTQGWVLTNPLNPNFYSLSISGGDSITNKNFFNFKLGKVSGIVFDDLNNNLIKDDNESTLSNWKIFAYANNEIIDSANTDELGNYIITDLRSGDYRIVQSFKEGWFQTLPSNPDYYNVSIYSGSEISNIDFGNFKYASISGTIFNDIDANGIKGRNETGLSFWKVKLFKDETLIDSTNSDENGLYSFSNLQYGIYKVLALPDSGWIKTAPQYDYYIIPVVSQDSIIDNNFGFFQLGNISGLVYNDVNGNGIKDNEDSGLYNFKILLYKNEILIDSIITDENGFYSFKNLHPGVYKIYQSIPVDWVQIFPYSPGFYIIVITSGKNVTARNFGNYEYGMISGYKFNDQDGDGEWDAEETGIANWKIRLYREGVQIDSVLTDTTGKYEFRQLTAGIYTVTEEEVTNWSQTTVPSVYEIEIKSGTKSENNNFGNYEYGMISGYKFNDQDGDGEWDAEETGIANWKIRLYREGVQIDSVLTDTTGKYEFRQLTAGIYTVTEEEVTNWSQTTVPSVYEIEIKSGTKSENNNFGNYEYGMISGYKFNDQDGDGEWDVEETGIANWKIRLYREGVQIDSVLTDTTGKYEFRQLTAGIYTVTEEEVTNWSQTTVPSVYEIEIKSGTKSENNNFGNYEYGMISGYKFNDQDGDGEWDVEETGIANWKIRLYREGVQIDSVLTDTTGKYEFRQLTAGIYTVTEEEVTNWSQTTVPSVYEIEIKSGTKSENNNFGNYEYGMISGYKFKDQDGDGEWDAEETGIANWKIRLYREGVQIDSVLTDTTGKYEFRELTAGIYTVTEEELTNWSQTTVPSVYEIEIRSGTKSENNNFGNYEYGMISGYKFKDQDGDGEWDVEETGIANWKIRLYREGVQIDSVLTDTTGKYEFRELTAGIYTVTEEELTNWSQTTVPSIYEIEIKSGTKSENNNFGNYEYGMISGYKFNDQDGDGEWDVEETGIANWKIRLYREGVQIDSVLTDTTGKYEFRQLTAGIYTVTEEEVTNWSQTTVPSVYEIEIKSGTKSENNNFGNYEYGMISGYKFKDQDGDGEWDAEETGIANWKIRLYREGVQIDSVLTDTTGKYEFRELTAGIYTVTEEELTNWSQTTVPSVYEIEIRSGTKSENNNFGNYEYGMISGYKFNDQDGDGEWDAEETGIANWKIRLYREGVQIDSVLTDTTGKYEFRELTAGIYTVTEEELTNWSQTTVPSVYEIEIKSGTKSENNNFGNYHHSIFALNIKVLIEGFYNAQQDVMVPDTIFVELRNVSYPFGLVARDSILLNEYGEGTGYFNNLVIGTPYYIVIKHRNSIETWSATGQIFNSSSLDYDFTTSANRAYGNNLVKIGNRWCIYSGDCNQDGWVDGLDMNIVDNDAANFVYGYNSSDVNGDSWTDGLDLNIVDNNSAKFIYSITPENSYKSNNLLNNQNPVYITYEYKLLNDSLVSPTIYEFDIYLKNTSDSVLEVANTQLGLSFNSLITNGGKLTFSIVPGSSEFLPSQIPSSFSVDTVNNLLRVAPRANPGTGNGTIISRTGNGTKLGRFRIINTVPFSPAKPDIAWNFISTGGKYLTRLSAYVNELAVETTVQSFHFINLTNPILNLPTMIHQYQAGWRLISIPLKVQDNRKDVLFPETKSPAFYFNGRYITSDTLFNGTGYWIKFDTSMAIVLSGFENTTDTIEVLSGWNLIGTISKPVPLEHIVTIPDNIIVSNFYNYNMKYVVTDTLQPFYGYWVKISQDGLLILNPLEMNNVFQKYQK